MPTYICHPLRCLSVQLTPLGQGKMPLRFLPGESTRLGRSSRGRWRLRGSSLPHYPTRLEKVAWLVVKRRKVTNEYTPTRGNITICDREAQRTGGGRESILRGSQMTCRALASPPNLNVMPGPCLGRSYLLSRSTSLGKNAFVAMSSLGSSRRRRVTPYRAGLCT